MRHVIVRPQQRWLARRTQKGFLGTGPLVTRKTRTPPHPCPSRRPPFSPSHQPAEMAPRRGGGKGEGSGQPPAPEFTVEQHGPASADHGGVVVHNKMQPIGGASRRWGGLNCHHQSHHGNYYGRPD
ncbi:hypothetical protein N9L68_08765 [bacterium]|nr:hypothetical protein [bacterium]